MERVETKRAPSEHPILDLIRDRWSPRAFSERPVPPEALLSVLEAARWAASSGNEQPWRFILATKREPDEHARLLSCLKESNRSWAQAAPVLALALAKRHRRDDETALNPHAWHDLGLALGNLSLQATALGLYVHLMGGFSAERARELYCVPAAFEPVTAVALGYLGSPAALPEDLQKREAAARSRKPLHELVFSGAWGEAAALTGVPTASDS